MQNLIVLLRRLTKKDISRRQFLKIAFTSILFSLSGGFFFKKAFAKADTSPARPKSGIKGNYDLILAAGKDPYTNTVKAVESMGGMERFVKKDAVVVIKPNMAWDRTPEQAANTDPEVVSALVDLSYKAGAKRVNIFEITCNEARRCYERSGIRLAAQEKGAKVYFADTWNVVKAKYDYKSQMEDWPILRDAVECDTFINVPVLKHHSLTGLTLSMKNLMGVCGGRRGLIHFNIGRKLVELTDFISPDLTVIDAHRVLVRNGPSGGNLEDVVRMDKLIVATDPTLADAYAAKLAGYDPLDIPYIKEAVQGNFGNINIEDANILELKT